MGTMKLPPVKIRMFGRVTPPVDLVAAARQSLSVEGFHALMQRTNDQPSSADICAAADKERTT